MSLDIDKYRQAFEPRNIFELIPRHNVEQMIKGFSVDVNRGAKLLYAEFDAEKARWVIQKDEIDPFDYGREQNKTLFNSFCPAFRNAVGHDRCVNGGRQIAQEYVDGVRTEPAIYKCWLGLDDIAYPLRVGGNTRAVLIAGQIVPDDDARVAEIKANVRAHAGEKLSETLAPIVDRDREGQWAQNSDYATFRKRSLEDFGEVFQEILDRLYSARKDAIMREILQRSNEILGTPHLSGSHPWWQCTQDLLESFCTLVGLEEVRLYTRERKSFGRRVPVDAPEQRILARDVVPVLPVDELVPASSDGATADLARQLDIGTGDVSFYLSSTYVEGIHEETQLSTLLALRGHADDVYGHLVFDFCRVLSNRADFASLVLHLESIHEGYKHTVAEVAHDFRTPLQVIAFDLDEVASLPAVRADAEIAARISQSTVRVIEASERTLELQKRATEKREPFNLVELVGQIVTDLQSLAREHPCKLVRAGRWPTVLTVRGVKSRLRRAIENLMQNAIKFSFSGRTADGSYQLYEVLVWVDECPHDLARLRISNYGMGVPQDLMERIREPGERALVHDSRRKRPGTGLGLPIAVRALEDHGGWLEMRSEPADSHTHARGEEYHRYKTVVDAYLRVFHERRSR